LVSSFADNFRSNIIGFFINCVDIIRKMRPLTEEEMRVLFEKLAKYIGRNITQLVEREDAAYVFRLHKQRVYYASARLVAQASSAHKKRLVGLGQCLGKFTKGGKFKLHITALDVLAPYARYKLWLKSAAELSFLYGNHVLKAGVARLTEATPQYQGVIVFSMRDVPLGFGVMARSTGEARSLAPQDIVCFHQADLGEYLREEDTAFS